MKILQFPLARITIGFLFGILLFRFVNFSDSFVFTCLVFNLSALLICSFYNFKHNLYKTIFGILVFLASTFIGISTSVIHKENKNTLHYINQVRDFEDIHQFDLLISEKLKSTSKNIRYIGLVKFLDGQKSYGKIILNIAKRDSVVNLKVGNHINVIGNIYKNKSPSNPNLFDYGKYLENQEIYAQVYSKKIIIGKYEPGLWADFSNFRETIIKNLKLSGISKNELNVLAALILGQQQDISPEILKDYQYAGAVHVLSVSGLHVGFILLFINTILKPIGNSRKGSFVKLCAILISLWGFAVLTGLSASIVRSATMFSFLAIGTHLRRTVNIYHTLLVSMLLILLFKPSFLFDVGFQLSYLALFFIIWLQPVFSNLWKPKNKILKYFWDIITVSFAAQIGAMPLSIYYFHQFPGLFFVTNLLILPLIGSIMAVGVIVIIIAACTTVPFLLARSIEFLVNLLNDIIHWVASFESLVIKNISYSKEMLFGSYLVIILIILWIKKPKYHLLAIAFISIIILQCTFILQKKETSSQRELIIFSLKKNTIITKRHGNAVTLYANDSTISNIDADITIQSYLNGNFCRLTSKRPLQNLIYFEHKKILIIDSFCVYSKNVIPEVLVIIQSPKLNMERLLSFYKPKQIIADGSNFKSYIQIWEATCRKEKIPFHNTNEKGFYRLDPD